MVDYIIANSMVLGMIDQITIKDYLTCTNLRNYHSHLLIQTHFGRSSQGRNLLVGETHCHWIPSIQHTQAEHNTTTDFVDGLAITVGGEYTTMDLLNVAVERYMLQQGILCRAVHKLENMKNGNLTKLVI